MGSGVGGGGAALPLLVIVKLKFHERNPFPELTRRVTTSVEAAVTVSVPPEESRVGFDAGVSPPLLEVHVSAVLPEGVVMAIPVQRSMEAFLMVYVSPTDREMFTFVVELLVRKQSTV